MAYAQCWILLIFIAQAVVTVVDSTWQKYAIARYSVDFAGARLAGLSAVFSKLKSLAAATRRRVRSRSKVY
jgi:hypothetical protein